MAVRVRILDKPEEMAAVEELQRTVWPGSEIDVVPMHMLVTAVHNGGLVIGAFEGSEMVGFVFGFPGFIATADGPKLKHCSHMLGVRPEFRDRGIGFSLKRAQWQMVRHQGLGLITWTFDPLLSRNAYLNLAKLGAICSAYLREVYGEMRDGLNAGLPSDRLQAELWVNSPRVKRRMSGRPRRRLDLAHYFEAGAQVLNPTRINDGGLPLPSPGAELPPLFPERDDSPSLLLLEIPADFLSLKAADPKLALEWRMHARRLFEGLFALGYIVTDSVYLQGTHPRSFYVLSHGESTLGE